MPCSAPHAAPHRTRLRRRSTATPKLDAMHCTPPPLSGPHTHIRPTSPSQPRYGYYRPSVRRPGTALRRFPMNNMYGYVKLVFLYVLLPWCHVAQGMDNAIQSSSTCRSQNNNTMASFDGGMFFCVFDFSSECTRDLFTRDLFTRNLCTRDLCTRDVCAATFAHATFAPATFAHATCANKSK